MERGDDSSPTAAAADINDEDKNVGGEEDHTTATLSISRNRNAATKPTALAEEEDDDEFSAATKKILTRGLGGKEDVVAKIMSDVSDYIRLDDLAEIKSVSDSTTGGIALICSKLQNYLNKNNNDEEFVIVVLEKLWTDFFCCTAQTKSARLNDKIRWIKHNNRWIKRQDINQTMFDSNGHILIIDSMNYYPNNSKIHEMGCRLLCSIGYYGCSGFSIGKYGGLKNDDHWSFRRFLVSERTMTVIATAVKNYMDKKREEDNNNNEVAAAQVVGSSLKVLGEIKHFLFVGAEFEEPYYQNMESLGIYPLAFEALQSYPQNGDCVYWGLRILLQRLVFMYARNILPADVLDRIITEKTRNVFDQVIDHAVAVQLEMDPETSVPQLAQELRAIMTL